MRMPKMNEHGDVFLRVRIYEKCSYHTGFSVLCEALANGDEASRTIEYENGNNVHRKKRYQTPPFFCLN
jgi:hypothetical protein